MKHLISLCLLFALSLTVSAQGFSKSEMKDLKKEAKKYEKDGWKTMPGALSLTDQLARAKRIALEEDEEGNEKWQIGTASSVGSIYDAARMQAMTLAKIELSSLITSMITADYLAASENKQLSQEEAESHVKAALEADGVSMDQELGSPRVIFDAYRKLSNGNVEVTIRVAVPQKRMKEVANKLLPAINDNL